MNRLGNVPFDSLAGWWIDCHVINQHFRPPEVERLKEDKSTTRP